MAVNVPVHVVTVGLPSGGLDDPEGAAVAQALGGAGLPVSARAFVDEDETALERVLAAEGGITVIVSGPGSSAGDIVRRVVARATAARLALNDRMLAALEERHRRHDRPLPRRDERLALLPQGAVVWTAGDDEPGWMLESPRGVFVVLPRGASVGLVTDRLVPLISGRFAGRGAVLTRTLKTAGVAIGDVEERLAGWLGKERDIAVVVAPADGEVWIRLRARGASPAEAAVALASAESDIGAALGVDCYGGEGDSLEQVVGRLLAARQLTLSVAESCTGGLLGHRITTVPGSSAYFERGVIVYSNRAKMELLGVPEAVLRAHGAVSAPTAEAMARGICDRSGSACGLSITGVAGPDGGTPAKPVGTVFIGLAVRDEVVARRFRFLGDRASIKWQSSLMALDMLRRKLAGE